MADIINGNGRDSSVPLLLVDNLTLHSPSKGVHQVAITQEQITCTPVSAESKKQILTLYFGDITGCECMKGHKGDELSAYVTIYAYPHKKKFASKKTLRQRTTLTLTFNQRPSYEENTREATKWKHLIQCLLKRLSISSSQDLCNLPVPAPKKYLIFINPFSGPGKAKKLFKERAVPMFAEAGVHYETIVTEYAGHARKVVQTLQLSKWDGIIIVSGDGLIYEVFNGLMSRPDWEKAIKMPLGALPGGSGNALCCALNYLAREPYMDQCFLHSMFLLTKAEPRPMDLVAVDTCKERLYSFLAITWGLIADVDIESERFRSLGPARFTVGALVKIAGMKKYRGRLSFIPVNKYERPPVKLKHSQSVDLPTTSGNVAGLTRSQSQVEEFNHATKAITRPKSQPAIGSLVEEQDSVNGELQEVFDDEDDETTKKDKAEVLDPSGTNGDLERVSDNGEDQTESADIVETPGNNLAENQQSNSPAVVPTPLLPPLSEPVPADWVTIEDDFIFILASYKSHLGTDAITIPSCKLDEGVMYLGIGRGAMTRQQVLGLMTAMSEGGNLVPHHNFEFFPVKAFRLEPITPKGIITVDGEQVDYGPIQAEVLPGISRIMAMQK